jgi:hypothetical protein
MMDITNLSKGEKAMLAFCGLFVVIFSSVMYYNMIIAPQQAASSQEAAPQAAYSQGNAGTIASDTLAPAAHQDASNVGSGSR